MTPYPFCLTLTIGATDVSEEFEKHLTVGLFLQKLSVICSDPFGGLIATEFPFLDKYIQITFFIIVLVSHVLLVSNN